MREQNETLYKRLEQEDNIILLKTFNDLILRGENEYFRILQNKSNIYISERGNNNYKNIKNYNYPISIVDIYLFSFLKI